MFCILHVIQFLLSDQDDDFIAPINNELKINIIYGML